MLSSDRSDAFNRKDSVQEIYLDDFFPSETKGDGRPVSNNLRTGAAQGRSSLITKAHCQQCGFPVDLSRVDHTGGSLDGNGAGGAITNQAGSYTYPNGTVLTTNDGVQVYSKNSGCPLCFSRNSAKDKRDVAQQNPWDRIQNLGF